MSDDHSELVPLLPIPNRTVKRLCADDSVRPYVKVGHRQAPTSEKPPSANLGVFLFPASHVIYFERSDARAEGACP